MNFIYWYNYILWKYSAEECVKLKQNDLDIDMIYCFYFLEEYNIEFPVKIILLQSNFLINHVLGKGVLLHMNNNSKIKTATNQNMVV